MKTVFEHTVRVRYAECDRMGFVHHSVFALYFEEARTEILRRFGITYKELEDEGFIMPVRHMDFRFYKAAVYDDLLRIKVRLESMPELRWKFNYETFNSAGDLLNKANTELFFVRKTDFKPVKLPVKYLQTIQNLFKD